jgi:hypothetical protein
MDPGIPESRREPVEERPRRPPLEISIEFVFVGDLIFRRWIDPVPAMNDENGRCHAFQTETREVIEQSGYDGLLPGSIERLHHDRRIAWDWLPRDCEIRTSVGVSVTDR